MHADVLNFLMRMAGLKMTAKDPKIPFDPAGALEVCEAIKEWSSPLPSAQTVGGWSPGAATGLPDCGISTAMTQVPRRWS